MVAPLRTTPSRRCSISWMIMARCSGSDNRIRQIPVINEWGMIGMLSFGDVVRAVVLDVCCSSGYLSFCCPSKSESMARLTHKDAVTLPFPDSGCDAATISYWLRKVVDRKKAIEEMVWVLKPGASYPFFACLFAVQARDYVKVQICNRLWVKETLKVVTAEIIGLTLMQSMEIISSRT
ncbi:2-phytyl-1-4-beta-naphthoquinone methyltransferase- chloroplastic [Striga hermonthica]|uniref:2-phytyl-1-4-beta-naphthoquinone methyltransferase- chloroplastic n=1 Tax=Striga hermonthica TaxID=68872 RepID=A0A9N7P1N7_STRHE|nr:2-phytyl-1-4-beta-naphthoquinone methyltransferase- chloroplastic [Striga hermonthica]